MKKNIKFKPTKGTVIVEIISKDKTEGGLFLPESAKDTDDAILRAAHPSFQEAIPVGAKVLIRSNSNTQRLKIEGDPSVYLVFEEKDILGSYE